MQNHSQDRSPTKTRLYLVSGADLVDGKNVQLLVRATSLANASEAANLRGILVSQCVLAAIDRSFRGVIMDDSVVQRLLAEIPQLGYRLRRMNAEDQVYLSNLGSELGGIAPADSLHVGRLIAETRRHRHARKIGNPAPQVRKETIGSK